MGIEIETPQDFLDDYKDPKYFQKILDHIQNVRFRKDFRPLPKEAHTMDAFPALEKAKGWLWQKACPSYWEEPIEANSGLGAQFILMSLGMQFPDRERLQQIFQCVLAKKEKNGLYSLYFDGPPHYSTNLLVYLAGRALGYDKASPELAPLSEYLQSENIHTATNMETKLLLAVYGLIDWNALPEISPLLLLIPREADFTIYSISYWVRTSLVPMAILSGKQYSFPSFPLSREEILSLHPEKKAFPPFEEKNRIWDDFLKNLDAICSLNREELLRLAIPQCERWILHHQDPSGDWGGIYPAMQYSLMALYALGHSLDHPAVRKGLQALIRFQRTQEIGFMQEPCSSPVWDTAWSLLALSHGGEDLSEERFQPYFDWLLSNQIFQEGDWSVANKTGFGGGWAFQFYNNWYPDTDDTAVVIMSLLHHPKPTPKMISAIRIGVRWLLTMQNPDGGWSAFEKGVDEAYVDKIPFNDMENWRDPSTADVTGRCLQMMGELKLDKDFACVRKAIQFLLKCQEQDGSWFGRWGVNYIYGTWSVVMGLRHYLPPEDPPLEKAYDWILSVQQPDGGWGESCQSYNEGHYIPLPESTASQTAWALLTLLALGKQETLAVEKGLAWLRDHQTEDGTWNEKYFTGTGFSKHFYLRYDYYRQYFPLWVLGESLHHHSW